jgi:hypothetical protein
LSLHERRNLSELDLHQLIFHWTFRANETWKTVQERKTKKNMFHQNLSGTLIAGSWAAL